MKKSMLCGLLTAMVMLLTSCNKDENDGGTPYVKISPTTDAIAFSADGSETYTYEIETNQPVWLANSDQDWCVVTMDAYNNKFTVTAVPNGASTAPTPAIITVSAGSENTLTITATQAAMTDYEVYVSGSYEDANFKRWACYWKDGVRKELSLPQDFTNSHCSSITVSGSSVYMAGEFDGKACYWKDNTRTDLKAPASAEEHFGEVNSIAVDGNKVYVCGTNHYWIDNSIKEYRSNFMGKAVAASGGLVYYAGVVDINIELGGSSIRKKMAYQWKGADSEGPTQLKAPRNADAEATCAFISGGSYYAGGVYLSGESYLPCYWRDGECTTLDIPQGMASNLGGIYVAGSTVYVAGTYVNGSKYFACYWENNTRKELELPANTYNVEVTGITVASGKVCIAGHYQDETDRPRACYWINGKRTDIPKGTNENAYTTGIALVVK